jgi:PAS domain S-box-containing protein
MTVSPLLRLWHRKLMSSPAAIAYLAAALVLSLGAWQIVRARDAAFLDAEGDARNLARSLAQHATRTIEAVDLVMSGIVDRLEHEALDRPARFKSFLEQRVTAIAQVRSIAVFDAQGTRISDSSVAPRSATESGGQEYFLGPRERVADTLYVATPIVGRTSGTVSVPLSRRWSKPDGSFGGVVVAFLNPDYFARFYATIGVGAQGRISLFSTAGRILARHPYEAGVLDLDLSGAPLFRERLPRAPAGSFRSSSPIDGLARLTAYERLERYPLVMSVAVAVEETLAAWRREALLEGLVLGAAALALVALGLALTRHGRRVRDAELALRGSEARYRLLAETTSDVITHLRLPDFVRVYVSPACRTLFGCEPAAMLGQRPSAGNMHPEDVAGVRAQAARLAQGDAEHAQVTYRAQHADGRWLWVEASLSLKRDAGTGTPKALVCALRDVTERQRAAAALSEAKQAAEAAAQAKAEFLATMSHEIRTPLNGVIGYADLLADDPGLTPVQRRHVARIQGAGAALLTVVNDILDYSKIEAGELELHPRPFAAAALVDGAAAIVRSVAERRGLSLTTALDPGLPAVLVGDEDRLRQVLLNLLGNAVKFTERGRVNLALAVTAATDETVSLRAWVTDTGIGIPADKRARLFERFSQVDGSVERRFGGTGLGLAISKQLVERMGGEIGVDSVEGAGSTFWFALTLPVASASLLPGASTAAGSAAPAPGAEPREAGVSVTGVPMAGVAGEGAVRILLVDDVPLNQELARAVLEAAGHAVDVVGDGASAIAAVQAHAYDLVLMDVQMPVMDGLTAARRIRALDHPARRVPIVAMTANVLPDQVAACRAAGMDDHVAKPFRREALQAVIARWAVKPADAATPAPPASSAIDESHYASMRDLLGAPKMDELLGDLAEMLRERSGAMTAAGAEAGEIAREAHVLVSSAGMLGFAELSERCAELEAACLQGREITDLLHAVRTARARALQEIETLRQAARDRRA